MPIRIPFYQQQTQVDMSGAPRAGMPAMRQDGIGSLLAEMGQELGRYGQELYKTQREADLTDRLGRATAELTDLELQFQRDSDFRTAPDRFKSSTDQIREKYLTDVQDPAVKQAFTKRFGELALSKSMNVRKDAFGKERDYNVASLDTSLDVYAQAAASARNPAERMLVEDQARLAIATMQSGNYIDAVEAGKRERGFRSKIDNAVVLRDMSADPNMVVAKLGIDPTYAPNIDPVLRERYIDQALRRSESNRKTLDAEAERVRKARGDEAAKDIWSRLADRKLTRDYLEQNRAFLDPGEYRSMLKAMSDPVERKDDPQAYAALELALESNPAEARRLAFQYHRSGIIRNETLNRITDNARSIERQEGPRSPYERERSFITNAIKPSDMVPDPAASARFALAIREYDDFAKSGQKTDAELRSKADDIIKRRSMVDMVDLATKTGVSNRPSPEQTIEAVDRKIVEENAAFTAGRISKGERDKRIQNLMKQRQAAEKANGNGRQ